MSKYNGYKFFNDVFISPTKSLLKTIDKTTTQFANYMKEPSEKESMNKSIKIEEEDDLMDEITIKPKASRPQGHKARHEVLSASTNATLPSPTENFIYKEESPIKDRESEKMESIRLHNRRIEAIQKEEGPILFVKGGYTQYVDIKSSKANHFRKSVCQNKTKGGFVIIEEEDSYKLDNPFKPPFADVNQVLDDPVNKQKSNQNDEIENFLSGELNFPQRKNRKSGSKKSLGGYVYDLHPLDNPSPRMSFTEASKVNRSSVHKRTTSSLTPRVVTEGNLLLDPLLAPITPRTTRAKASISLVKADSSTQNTTFTDSFSLIKPETPINAQHSKKNSMIIFEDESIICSYLLFKYQTASHLEISLIEEETEEPKEFEEDSSSKIFGAKPITRSNSKLIEE